MEEKKEEIKTRTFEEILPIIDRLLKMAAHKWNLKANPSVDFFDISQIIRVHLWKKFSQYKQDLPIEPWINTIINNQLKNLLRNHYYQNISPCARCCENEGGNLCRTFITQSNMECPIFAKWSKTKKNAFNVRLALPLENHSQEVSDIPFHDSNLEKNAEILHKKMLSILKPLERKIYIYLYIEMLSDEEIAKKMNYKTNEKGRTAGYNNLIRTKKKILEKVRETIKEIDIY